MSLVGLEGFGGYYPHALSGGMQQRLALARTLANEPRLLLLDEPFGALDAKTRAEMQELILAVRAKLGTAIMVVTHDVEEAVFLGDRVCILSPRPASVISYATQNESED
jgi:ABC-type nitrate/sulfonate/bicarbonate transport system ATPase subunit